MIENRLKKTAIMTAIFAVLSLGIMFYRAITKNIMIVEATQEQAEFTVTDEAFDLMINKPTDDKGKGTLVIPLEAGVGSDDITLEEKHAEHKFILFINGKTREFYTQNAVISDLDLIENATYSFLDDKGRVCLEFALDGLYENETALGDKEIVVSFNSPQELYENTVVIDPVDDTGVAVIPYIKKIFDGNDRVRIFYTRQTKTDGADADVTALVSEAEADFYIQVGGDISDDDQSGVRTYYNGRYFIRGFGNVQFADQMERNLAINAGVHALGLFEAADDRYEIMQSRIPSAYVSLGNPGNAEDAARMVQEEYLEKCAKGIADGIIASFDIVNPEEVQEEADPLQGIINGN